jgi:hypothetical protein
MRVLILVLALAGCAERQSAAEIEKGQVGVAQRNLDEMRPACRDGVEYLVTPSRQVDFAIAVPHLKPDGKPFTCAVQP